MTGTSGTPDQRSVGTGVPPEIDVSRPHPARMYDYFLGGKDNFAADRAVAGKVLESWGAVRTAVRENRAFLRHRPCVSRRWHPRRAPDLR